MRAALRLERFDNIRYRQYMGRDKSTCWVARITGFDEKYFFAREFQRGYADYSRAKGTGSRGIWVLYALDDGIYEINERKSWKHIRRRFIRVQNAEITEISREEVEQWLRQNEDSASTS